MKAILWRCIFQHVFNDGQQNLSSRIWEIIESEFTNFRNKKPSDTDPNVTMEDNCNSLL